MGQNHTHNEFINRSSLNWNWEELNMVSQSYALYYSKCLLTNLMKEEMLNKSTDDRKLIRAWLRKWPENNKKKKKGTVVRLQNKN